MFPSFPRSTSIGSKLYRSAVDNIFFNFSVEEFLTQSAKITGPVLFLWRNKPTVLIGRHQNPWKECRLNLLDKDGVVLGRRYSGGGTIYQDMQCTQFTFVNPSEDFSVATNFEMIIRSLSNLGVKCEVSGRNDIVTSGENKKVSGSAFRLLPATQKRDAISLHHGTLLINTDMTALGKYLTPNKLKLESKGVKSVAARVVNLKDLEPSLNHDVVCSAIEREFCTHYGMPVDTPSELLTTDSPLLAVPDFERYYDNLSDWNWRFGRTPEFSHNMETRIDGVGMFDVHCQVTNAHIDKIVIFSDALLPHVIDQIVEALQGVVYTAEAVRLALEPLAIDNNQMLVQSFTDWFTSVVES